MRACFTYQKKIAFLLLSILIADLGLPATCYALTSGPTQPETQKFEIASANDMVDLFTGDFKYNIPLLDIDGYPINLNYEAGAGMDDEASWTGLGWNVNLGAVNRQLRGLPDDMKGDLVSTEHYVKPKVTIGGRVSGKVEIFGSAESFVKVGGSLSFGVFNDNYTGMGGEVGANAGISVGKQNDGSLTAGMGLGILSNTSSGVNVTPYANLTLYEKKAKTTLNQGVNISLGYNSRSGIKDLSLGTSFSVRVDNDKHSEFNQGMWDMGRSSISYNTEPIYPSAEIAYKTKYESFSIDVGPTGYGIFGGVGATGYKSTRQVAERNISNPAYGFLYANIGKNDKNALMDFVREKDNPIVPDLPNLALPVFTPDLFTFTSQAGSGQFRLYQGGSGAFFDNEVSDKTDNTTFGVDIGYGAGVHVGVTLFDQNITNTTHKWTSDNQFLPGADFATNTFNERNNFEPVYFKVVGEKSTETTGLAPLLSGSSAVSVNISGKTALNTLSNAQPVGSDGLKAFGRQARSTTIAYLTAEEASLSGLNRTILHYPAIDYLSSAPHQDVSGAGAGDIVSDFTPAEGHLLSGSTLPRYGDEIRKRHHISSISVNTTDGKRMVYDVPTYNLRQDEYAFAVGKVNAPDITNNNQVALQGSVSGNDLVITSNQGIDHYFHKQGQPAYATSYLLSAILSPDYIDVDNNGISETDRGTAIKFNYTKIAGTYAWRTPYDQGKAILNKGQLADQDDDKGNVIYGEKELWYAHSIETRTKIVYFITAERLDGLGVAGPNGGKGQQVHQRMLKEIRLYSKNDISRPIKVVKFEYNYELCPQTPNSDAPEQGKLTLKRVYFQYGNTRKGRYHAYTFNYNKEITGGEPIGYQAMQTDRWGTYKPGNSNRAAGLSNEEFPYTNQDLDGTTMQKQKADSYAGLWNLSQIALPTGGAIDISYESDDYAFVQNKKAMAMAPVEELIGSGGQVVEDMSNATGVRIKATAVPPPGVNILQWFKDAYLNGSDQLYARFYLHIATSNSATDEDHAWDYVTCFAKVSGVSNSDGWLNIQFEQQDSDGVVANPILASAWQKLKNEYPRYAYPGFDRRNNSPSSVSSAVQSIVDAIGNLKELRQNFYQTAKGRQYATRWKKEKSYIRVVKTDGRKLGGGCRVRKIQINDNWLGMSTTSENAVYGQAYDYTTLGEDNQVISSGVASYEPSLGNDENPLHLPIAYRERVKGGIGNLFELIEPFGESYFPAPVIGYGRVKITDLVQGQTDPKLRTGFRTEEFYTAKDFPVQVSYTRLNKHTHNGSGGYNFFSADVSTESTYSQGYSILLNDMHGKPKASRTFKQPENVGSASALDQLLYAASSEIASTVYQYKVENAGTPTQRLNNKFSVVNSHNEVTDQVIGREVDFFTDFREQESNNQGRSLNGGFDGFLIGFFPIIIPHRPSYTDSEYKLFRSACAVKVVHDHGVVSKVIKTINGSSIATQYLVFDSITGDPVVTSTQNEFKALIYSINLPAYWMYAGMGPSYKNVGTIMNDLATDNKGTVTSSIYSTFLHKGDEVANLNSGETYWVIDQPGTSDKMLIDDTGRAVSYLNRLGCGAVLTKIIRSGYRNLLNESAGSIVSLQYPVASNRLQLLNGETSPLKVVNASSAVFSENWDTQPDREVLSGDAVSNYASEFKWRAVPYVNNYAQNGVVFVVNGAAGAPSQISSLQGRFNEATIWSASPAHIIDRKIGFDVDFYVCESRLYQVGYGGDDEFSFLIDGQVIPNTKGTGAYLYWQLSLMFLTKGFHHLTAQGENFNQGRTGSNDAETEEKNPGSLALEIYANTTEEMLSGTGLNVVFSTRELVDKYLPSYRATGPALNSPRTTNFTNRQYFNPYLNGLLGNWRSSQSVAFLTAREYGTMQAPGSKGVNVKYAGTLSNFSPYWRFGPDGWQENNDAPGANGSWVKANTVTLYDRYGQQLENKDALGRYSAASFEFSGELPASVASNAMRREIYALSFENFKQLPTGGQSYSFTGYGLTDLRNTDAHTGNYCVQLPAQGIAMNTALFNNLNAPAQIWTRSVYGEYAFNASANLIPDAFRPRTGTYLIQMWINDLDPTHREPAIILKQNGVEVSGVQCKALVEGWKLIEANVSMTGNEGAPISLQILPSPGRTVLVDDIRMHPIASQMKTYVYDHRTFRLMAELDENGLASLYEYDDEGSLIRVKKETERGVMTIKESRSSYTKKL